MELQGRVHWPKRSLIKLLISRYRLANAPSIFFSIIDYSPVFKGCVTHFGVQNNTLGPSSDNMLMLYVTGSSISLRQHILPRLNHRADNRGLRGARSQSLYGHRFWFIWLIATISFAKHCGASLKWDRSFFVMSYLIALITRPRSMLDQSPSPSPSPSPFPSRFEVSK